MSGLLIQVFIGAAVAGFVQGLSGFAFGLAAMHTLTLTVYAVDGAITAETGRMFAVIAPTLVVPCLIGARLYSRVSEIQFRRLVLGLLFLSGLGLLAASGSRLLGR